ncbi:MAG: hypothetical protein MUF10_09035, partial [Thermoanaerobaculaceae bacterium]|nr:hypothetical protein [Thermoanaerobaculaceae bacterium]
MSRLGHTSVLVFASLLSITLNVRAQQPLNQQRGYDPTAVYSGSGIDNVNLFGGNLSMAIPLGQRYTVGPTLSYGFTLVYNSHVWDFKKAWCTPGKMSTGGEWGVSASPTKASNAGLGWFLSLGFLSIDEAGNIVAYIDSGGGEHVFFQKLHEDDGPGDSSFRYTRDGSYLRLHTTSNAATVEFPDGTVHTFWPSSASPCTPTTCDWRIRQMADRFSNAVTVTWNDTVSPATWTVSDSTGRSHTITMATSPTGIARVASVSLAAFGGTSATYSFSYPARDASIETSMLTSPACYGWPLSATVTFLVGIGLPDGSAYSMLDASGAAAYHLASVDNTDTSGALKQMQLPTGGVIQWAYAPWHLPRGCQYNWMPNLTNSLGVATRQQCDSSGFNCTTWTYTRPTPGPTDLDVSTTVTSPPAIAGAPGGDGTGNDTVYYFRTNSCSTGATDYSAWDYGLGYTQSATDGAGHYLSSKSYQGSATSGTLKRSTYVAYEHDKLATLSYPPGGSANTSPWWSTNRRLASTRTVYDDDASRYADVVSTSFDGLGHYRQAATNGNFDAGNQRTTFTGFNPDPLTSAYRTYQIDAGNAQLGTWGTWAWQTSKPWILGTYNVTSQTENGVTAFQEACFERDDDSYPSTGFLRAARVMNAATEEKTDLLTVFTRDSLGQVISEQYLGGDTQTEELPTYCNAATSRVSGDQLSIDHTYQYRTLRTSTYVDGSGQALSFKSLDLDIDRNTGFPSASRDSAGIKTNYVYDSMARLTWVRPASGHGAYVEHQYLPWSTSDAARIESCAKANGTTTPCTASTDSLTRSSVRFDDLGRPNLEKTRLPSVTGGLTAGFAPYEVGMSEDWTQRKATFGAAGWVHWTSEWYPNGTADAAMSKTTSTSFDPFG